MNYNRTRVLYRAETMPLKLIETEVRQWLGSVHILKW